MDELDGSERTLLSIYYVHIIALLKVAWDNGTVCSLVAAFAFSINSLLVKLLDGRVPTSEIVLVRRCATHVQLNCVTCKLQLCNMLSCACCVVILY